MSDEASFVISNADHDAELPHALIIAAEVFDEDGGLASLTSFSASNLPWTKEEADEVVDLMVFAHTSSGLTLTDITTSTI